MKNKLLIRILLIMVIASICSFVVFYSRKIVLEKKEAERQELIRKEEQKEDILKYYNKYVIAELDIPLYKRIDNKYQKSGLIGKNQTIELKEIDISYDTLYFQLADFEEYYVSYKDVSKTEEIEGNQRYKKYIPYNENVITNDEVNFYDENNNLVFNFSNSYTLPIIIKDTDKYGIEFNNQLLYVKRNDIKEVIQNHNTDLNNTPSIAVLNYHFFFDDAYENERKECAQSICISTTNLKAHLDYIKNNDFFTPTLKEYEMYLDQKIQLPKSVVITIDDGWRMDQGIYILEEYGLNATVFLITSWFDKVDFLHNFKYIEFHSHGDNLHNPGVCSGGQGGAIKCKDKSFLLNDLAISREKLGGTSYFCYPFYEYNSYSISVLKEAGFTMAFVGGSRKSYIGVDKYKIPRYPIYSSTTVAKIASYIN